jgi:hypothetical protein
MPAVLVDAAMARRELSDDEQLFQAMLAFDDQ